jgi:hypothetical protein
MNENSYEILIIILRALIILFGDKLYKLFDKIVLKSLENFLVDSYYLWVYNETLNHSRKLVIVFGY